MMIRKGEYDEAIKLLGESVKLINFIPNRKAYGSYPTSYELASAIDRFLKRQKPIK